LREDCDKETDMKSQETILSDIRRDIRMTATRRKTVHAGEFAGWLDHAAGMLPKVEDDDVRAGLFLEIVKRTLKLLREVDDSNASLQSVLWEGSRCFEAWKLICRTSNLSRLESILDAVLPDDEDGLADGLFFTESDLPVPGSGLEELLAHVLHGLKTVEKRRRETIAAGCLGWLAQLEDENGFEELAKKAKIPGFLVWNRRFVLYLNLARWDDAVRVAREWKGDNPRVLRELMLRVFERNGDRALLLETALEMARHRPDIEGFKRLDPLLTEDERARFVAEAVEAALGRPGFDVRFCEVLFAAGEMKALHGYAVSRYRDIFAVQPCTGMVPLGKKLFKAGDALAACIFMRGAIRYLMGRNNSRYYADVHVYRRALAEMASSVADWETVEPQDAFDAAFAADFAGRRTFWH